MATKKCLALGTQGLLKMKECLLNITWDRVAHSFFHPHAWLYKAHGNKFQRYHFFKCWATSDFVHNTSSRGHRKNQLDFTVTAIFLLWFLAVPANAQESFQKIIPRVSGESMSSAIINFSALTQEKTAEFSLTPIPQGPKERQVAPSPELKIAPFQDLNVTNPSVPKELLKLERTSTENIEESGFPQEFTPNSHEPLSEVEALSPPPSNSFLALEDSGTSIPPDTHGAVGPNHLMVTLNTQVRIQDRNGASLSTVILEDFWNPLLGNPGINVFDPKVLYDPFAGRWMFTAMAESSSPNSSVLIAVSETSDPTGNWFAWSIDADPNDINWADFPSMGFNKDWIVITANMFPNAGGSLVQKKVYVFDKANLYAGVNTATFTLFEVPDGGTMGPSITYDNSLGTMYFLEDWQSNSGGNGVLRLSTLTGSPGNEVFTTGVAFPATPNPWNFNAPQNNFAPQLNSPEKIHTVDARIRDVVYRNGTLWTTHTVYLPAGAPTRSAIQWWELDLDGTVLQRGRIDDPSGNIFFAFPSIAVNAVNDVLIGYSRFSANQFASGNYSFRFGGDPSNTLQADTVLKAGEAPYFKTFSGTRNRWGDYSATVIDPLNDLDFWTIQEYAALPIGGSDRWGTWWGKIEPGTEIPSIIDPPPFSTLTSKSVTFSGEHLNGDVQHTLRIGTFPGAFDIGSFDLGADHSKLVQTLPTSGTIYVQYGSRIGSTFVLQDHIYTMAVNHLLSVVVAGEGSGSVKSLFPLGIDCPFDCTESIEQGTLVHLQATPTPGSEFIGWSGGGCSGTSVCVLTMNEAKTVTASFGAAACTFDGHEPDNSSVEATTLVSGIAKTHTICSIGDTDWSTFTLTEASGVVLETSDSQGDTFMRLFDGVLNQLDSDNDSGAQTFSRIDRACGTDQTLSAGTYFVQVEEFGNNTTLEDYQLTLTSTPCGNVGAGTTSRVSVDSNGVEANLESFAPALNETGNIVAFESDASNLVLNDTNDRTDIFVHDRGTQVTTRVSVDSNGNEGNGSSSGSALSGDGHMVAFDSSSSNLVLNDNNVVTDVFVHDRTSGSTARVSVDSAGVEGNDQSRSSAVNGDGHVIVFQSRATNLVLNDTNAADDIFVHDHQTGSTTRVSVNSLGEQANNDSDNPDITPDGRYVTFSSFASNLVANDTNNMSDIFLHDRQTGTTTLVSVNSNGDESDGSSSHPVLSADARFVAFHSDATNLDGVDDNFLEDVFVHDRQTGVTTRISVDESGNEGIDESRFPEISDDGQWIAFSSQNPFVANDTNGTGDIFLFDRVNGVLSRVTVNSDGVGANQNSDSLALSGDGRVTAFSSQAFNLVPGDGNNEKDIFVHETGASQELLRVDVTGTGSGMVSSDPSGITCPNDCTETYVRGTMVTLTAQEDAGSIFAGWAGCEVVNGKDCVVTLTENVTATVTFDLPFQFYTLTVTTEGTGSGSVTSVPTGIDCPGDCTENYQEDTGVLLSAIQDPGSTFLGFSGDPDCTDGVVSMDANKTCIATFELDQNVVFPSLLGTYSVTGSTTWTGCSDPTNDGTYPVTGTVIIDAQMGGDFRGRTVLTNAPFNATDHGILTGVVTLDGTVSGGFESDFFIDGIFDSSSQGGFTGSLLNNTLTVNFFGQDIVGDICVLEGSFTGPFIAEAFTLSMTKVGLGTVTSAPLGIECGEECSAGYQANQQVELTAVADGGLVFAGFTGHPDCVDGTVTMDAARSCIATFTPLGGAVPAQELLWAKQAGGTGNEEGSGSIDSAGNSYVAGEFEDSATFGFGEANETILTSLGLRDIFLAKYDPSGNVVWAKRAGGVDDARAGGTVLDRSGNLFAGGEFEGSVTFGEIGNETTLTSAGGSESWLGKFDPSNGAVIWVKRLGQVYLSRPGFDNAGNMYLTGSFEGTVTLCPDDPNGTTLISSGGFDLYIAKLNPSGDLVWVKQVHGPGDIENRLATDALGNIFAFGDFNSSATFGQGEVNETTLTSDGARDLFLAKFDPNGDLAWIKQEGGVDDESTDGIALDGAGNIFGIGGFGDWAGPSATITLGDENPTILTSQGSGDIFIAKYDPSGNLLWAKGAGGTGFDDIEGIDVDALGNSYVLGDFGGFFGSTITFELGQPNETILNSGGLLHLYIAKFDSNGNLVWARRSGGLGDGDTGDISVDGSGNIHITGFFTGTAVFGLGEANETTLPSAGGSDFFIAKFSAPVQMLTVTKTGSGSGLVTSNDGLIDCGLVCTADFPEHQIVTLIPTPDVGSLFTGFTGDPDCADSMVTMDASKTCIATFELEVIPDPVLSVVLDGTGSGTVTSSPAGIDCATGTLVDCDEAYPNGQVVDLMGVADLGSIFVGFSGDPDCVDGNVLMNADVTCTATFAELPPATLTITMAGTGSGTITSTPAGINCATSILADCDESYPNGQMVNLLAVADLGSMFVGFSGDPDCADGRVIMAADRHCIVTFSLPTGGMPSNQFLFADRLEGLYRMTSAGVASFIGPLAHAAKGLAFVGSQLFSVSRNDALLRMVNSQDATTSSSLPLLLEGEIIQGATGLATQPNTELLWVLLKLEGQVGRELITVDLFTGVTTRIGNTGDKFAGLVFDQTGILYGVTGDGAATPETLFQIDLSNGMPTQVLNLGNGTDGEAIAFLPFNNLLYHASGLGTLNINKIFETIDLATLTVTNVPLSGVEYDEILAITNLVEEAFILTMTIDGSGAGRVASSPAGIDCATGTLVDCDEAYANGQTVDLLAVADLGSTFVGFTGDPDCVDGIVTIDASKTCMATFNLEPIPDPELSVVPFGAGSGIVTSLPPGIHCPANCSESLPSGTVVTLIVLADPGSFFIGWTGCVPNPSNPLECSVTVTQDQTVTAEFGVAAGLPDQVSFAISTLGIAEDGSQIPIVVTRTGAPGAAISIDVSSADGSATQGSDYTAVSETLVWAANDFAPKTILVPILNDTEQEGSETFLLHLSNPAGGVVIGAIPSMPVTIRDTDSTPLSSALTGEWHVQSYSDIRGLNFPDWGQGMIEVNEFGMVVGSMLSNSDGLTVTVVSGAVTLHPDRSVTGWSTFSNGITSVFEGSLDMHQTHMAGVTTDTSNGRGLAMFIKKGTTFTQSDMAGTYHIQSFGDARNVQSPVRVNGHLTSDDVGNVNGQSNNTEGFQADFSGLLTLEPDGRVTGSTTNINGPTLDSFGAMDAQKTLMARVLVSPQNSRRAFNVLIREGTEFTTPNLAGTWQLFIARDFREFNNPIWIKAILTLDATGNVTDGLMRISEGLSFAVISGAFSLTDTGELVGSWTLENGVTIQSKGSMDVNKTFAATVGTTGLIGANNTRNMALWIKKAQAVSADVDGNGVADALTDGMLILRYLFGFKNEGLINGVLALDAVRTTPNAILAYLDSIRDILLDVDENGKADAFTDGFLIARFLMGFTGNSLIDRVLDPSGTRTSAEAIQGFLSEFLPDTTPPTVSITNPHTGSQVNTNVISVTGFVNDTTTTVQVNGIPAALYGNVFVVTSIPLLEGVNTIQATATDPAGNSATDSIQVTLIPGTTVVGTVLDSEGAPVPDATVTTNTGQSAISGADGTFLIQNVPSGTDPIQVEAELVGNGVIRQGLSASVQPVPNGITDVGGIIISIPSVGAFSAPIHFQIGDSPRAVAVGDLNNDQILDLAVMSTESNSSTPSVNILLGDGSGNFALSTSQPMVPIPDGSRIFDVNGIILGDFNEDGFLDVIVGNLGTSQNPGNTATIFEGDGNGHLVNGGEFFVGEIPSLLLTADFNGDQHLDLAAGIAGSDPAGDGPYILLGDGLGGFSGPTQFPSGLLPSGLHRNGVSADFTRDGNLDLAMHFQHDVHIYAGNGNGAFALFDSYGVTGANGGLIGGDFNGDHYMDLGVASLDASGLVTRLGDETGMFKNAPDAVFDTAGQPTSPVIGDFNGDNILDAAIVALFNDISILFGNVDGTFRSANKLIPVQQARGLAVGHLNGDQFMDLVVLEANQLSVYVWQPNAAVLNDQNPPELTVPDDRIMIAITANGIDRADPQIELFLGEAIAIDDVSGFLRVQNDAPDFFGLGETIVTFTATDANGNVSQDIASITVIPDPLTTVLGTIVANGQPVSGVSVTVDGIQTVTDANGSFAVAGLPTLAPIDISASTVINGFQFSAILVGVIPNQAGPTDVGQITLISEPDFDLDGMPDSFENLHGFNPNDPSDASLDADFDGITNLEEFQRGSNPREFTFLGFFLQESDLTFTALADGASQHDSVGISNFGNIGLDWNASADMPWVILDTTTGQVPENSLFDLHFSVDPSGLAPGLYHAAIIINAPGVTFPPDTIVVNITFAILENSPRGQLFAGEIIPADDGFQAILAGDPTNAEAHFFRAITRLLRIVEENQDGPNAGTFTDSLKEMLDRFGFDPLGRSLTLFTSRPPEDQNGQYILPNDSPTGADVQEFWETVVTPELTAAIQQNLLMLNQNFGLTLTAAELTALDITNEGPVEVDYGEVKLLEAALHTLRAASFIGRAYEGNVDLDHINNAHDALNIQQDVINADPNLFTLKADGAAKLAAAKMELNGGIQSYLDASAFIRGEVDDQNNDLIMIAPEDLLEEEKVRTRLTEIQTSLTGQAFIDNELVDLSLFFDTPFDLRGFLPMFGFDATRTPTNFIEPGTFPDPTFNGMLPNMTPQRLEQLLNVQP